MSRVAAQTGSQDKSDLGGLAFDDQSLGVARTRRKPAYFLEQSAVCRKGPEDAGVRRIVANDVNRDNPIGEIEIRSQPVRTRIERVFE